MAIRKSWLPLIIYLVGIVFTHHPMLFSGMQKVQTNPEDTRLINYLLEHSFQWVRGNSLHRTSGALPSFIRRRTRWLTRTRFERRPTVLAMAAGRSSP